MQNSLGFQEIMMIIPEKIMQAVSILVFQEGKAQFTREEIRQKIGVAREG
jgi:hypothetical protein